MSGDGRDKADTRPVWLRRLPRESAQAWEAFEVYRDMGADRSLDHVSRKCNKSKSLLARWSVKYGWGKRVRAFDEAEAAALSNRELEAAAAEGQMWADRRRAQREEEWALSRALVEKAREMLLYPLAAQETTETLDNEKGTVTVTTVIRPARWGFRDAARMVDVASKLSRLAAEMTLAAEDAMGQPAAVGPAVKGYFVFSPDLWPKAGDTVPDGVNVPDEVKEALAHYRAAQAETSDGDPEGEDE